jgi:hypothetical protein
MKPRVSMVRNFVLLTAAVVGLGAFTAITREAQETCTAVVAETSCAWDGGIAYFSSDASGTISGDTLNLNTGAIYVTPSNGPDQAARRGYVRTTRRTPSGRSANVITRPTPDGGSPATATYLNVSYTSDSSLVALLQGTLTQPSTLQPGCQITYGSAGSTESNIPNPDSLLVWFGTQFQITIPNYPNPTCN